MKNHELPGTYIVLILICGVGLPVVWVIWMVRRSILAPSLWDAVADPVPWALFAGNWALNILIFMGAAYHWAKLRKRTASDNG